MSAPFSDDDIDEMLSEDDNPDDDEDAGVGYPEPLTPAAFHGLAGEFVDLVLPATEASPAALLVSLLVAVGSLVGHHAHVILESTYHFANLYALIIGPTSGGRKGTSWDYVKMVMRLIDRHAPHRTFAGFNSGEGLVHHCRDPIFYEKSTDPGVPDKRILVVDSEFGRTLAAMSREGSTLSALYRMAWDSVEVLRVGTKSSDEQATGAHIAVVAHITRSELAKRLREVEIDSGLLNRFIGCASHRSKLLPRGGGLPPEQIAEYKRIVTAIGNAVVGAERRDEAVLFDDDAGEAYDALYLRELAHGPPGLLGSATARGAAQVARLSLLYALLDESTIIRVQHVDAAAAIWRYSVATLGFALGQRILDDPLTLKVLAVLEQASDDAPFVSRRELHRSLSRHATAEALSAVLTALEERGMIVHQRIPTPGRTKQLYALASKVARYEASHPSLKSVLG
jgi:hypothetical protein